MVLFGQMHQGASAMVMFMLEVVANTQPAVERSSTGAGCFTRHAWLHSSSPAGSGLVLPPLASPAREGEQLFRQPHGPAIHAAIRKAGHDTSNWHGLSGCLSPPPPGGGGCCQLVFTCRGGGLLAGPPSVRGGGLRLMAGLSVH